MHLKTTLLLFLSFVSFGYSQATSVYITLLNLPDHIEGKALTIVHNYNNWTNNDQTTVTNHTAGFVIDNIITSNLVGYHDSVEGDNFAFRFIDPITQESSIVSYFPTNDRNFRVRLEKGIKNDIIIDVQSMKALVLDQNKYLSLNGVIVDPSPALRINPKLFTYPNGKRKGLIISVDDNRTEDRKMVELLNKYKLTGVFNLITGALYNDDPLHIKKDEVNTLYKGHEIGSHTINQSGLETFTPYQVELQVGRSQDSLAKITGNTIEGIAYPYGNYTDAILSAVINRSYTYGRGTIKTNQMTLPNDMNIDLLRWNPTGELDLEADYWADELVKYKGDEMVLVSLYGHSLKHVGQWDYIETAYAKLGADLDNIWNPTTREMANYLTALAEVVDRGTEFYNPSFDVSVWLNFGTNVVELKPGATIDKPLSVAGYDLTEDSTFDIKVSYSDFDDTITLSLFNKEDAPLNFNIYDLSGRLVTSIVKYDVLQGEQTIVIDHLNISCGTYILTVQSENCFESKKIICNCN